MTLPRILAIMGSGETAPTMAKVHRALLGRLGDAGRVAIVDTPYGFQENADELSSRAVEFFETNVGSPAAVASLRTADADALAVASAVARIREATYVMAGPGSPTYALRQWAGGPIADTLAAKLTDGGIVTMASAAALTMGASTIPVYEIYKAGEPPHWLEGLDLLGRATGLRAALVPHYDNAEGGTHDTRFCYMGERRLRALERMLPDGTFVLGVDGHTALVLDLDLGVASIAGLGGVTVRSRGRSTAIPNGAQVPIERLGSIATELAAGGEPDVEAALDEGSAVAEGASEARPGRRAGSGSIRDEMTRLEGAFVGSLDRGDSHGAAEALLDLDEAISGRIRTGEDSPDLDNARATFRSMIARLAERAGEAQGDVAPVVEPFVSTLLELRGRAREERDWPTADLIRDRLADAGVEVRDGSGDSSWVVRDRG